MMESATAEAISMCTCCETKQPRETLGGNSNAEMKSKGVILKWVRDEPEGQDALNIFARSEWKTKLLHSPLSMTKSSRSYFSGQVDHYLLKICNGIGSCFDYFSWFC